MITMSLYSILRLAAQDYPSYNQDISIGAKQVSTYLISGKITTYSEDIGYLDEEGQANTIMLDNHRLVKTPGYETIIYDIDELSFSEENEYLFMTVTRDDKEYTFMIGDLYEKEVDEVEENEEADSSQQ